MHIENAQKISLAVFFFTGVQEYAHHAAKSQAVHAAVEAQNPRAMLEFLLENGFNPNVRGPEPDVNTPMITCAKKIRHGTNSPWIKEKDSIGVLKLLVQHRGDVNGKDARMRTALWWSAKFNNYDACLTLLHMRANPEVYDRSLTLPTDVTTKDSSLTKLLYVYTGFRCHIYNGSRCHVC